ncbi:oxygen-independent coproporphyrinogen-3 oxidase [Clostridium tetanomorphum]|uniref:Coproporphyrinogen III oxidase n=1 Tax=Clostridium tetanomorphum TaxID=1553 RepID=A0A923EA38_CLOTT|nr:coproporphyrinogen III oxidase [Clostridium tetanomorphum]KAJ49452.1 coproporphyrinogen III oxidase [Clostridium tetanomorphum DSM 665]KAJ53689.1 coproporphyrinogen III oxidase [Clostridium tetanomorphum DSM 665]MBC2397199.1 coproporphyrinogen III oxidase [Clostridium tetanomorphum]MBP1862413.1 oxygen-independent coproporphyrinogen-3 oxidase [Clostridium tetanomorphum]NRS85747.1 oxygen-independent coproporphyrinogen-3 oxidase [Clostridium tetanomorphum]
MVINIELNNLKYRYDVYQIFNLFYPFNALVFEETNAQYKIYIEENKVIAQHKDNYKEYFMKDSKQRKRDIKKAIYLFLKDETGKNFPWGTLIGIRPSKIALSFLNEGKSQEEIINYFNENYLASSEKAKLCIRIAEVGKKMVNKYEDNISIYLGMPFCPTRCLYCSFTSNSVSGCKKLVKPYINSLIYEIEEIYKFIKENNLNIQTVYFGGGTPTAVSNEEFEYIMEKIYNKFICGNNIEEFTVECGRPDSLTYEKFLSMKKYKVSRISINPQTMNEDTLKLIGRNHSVSEVIEKFNLARELGFDNINMDVIVGLPGEGLEHIKNTCEEIAKLKPDNLTVHGMSLKRGSKLYENMEHYLKQIDQNELNLMYRETVKLAEVLGMSPYYMYRQKNMLGNMENVGYSSPGKEGIYNIQMIEEKQTIIAMGADAVTKVIFLDENRIERVPNVKDVIEYNKRVKEMVERKFIELKKLYK